MPLCCSVPLVPAQTTEKSRRAQIGPSRVERPLLRRADAEGRGSDARFRLVDSVRGAPSGLP